MAHDKMRGFGLIEGAAWGGIGIAILAAAYMAGSLIAHWCTFIPWR